MLTKSPKTQTQVPLSGLQYMLQPPLGLLVADVPGVATHFVSDQSSDALSNNLPFCSGTKSLCIVSIPYLGSRGTREQKCSS